jgi:hypothetical protein
MLPTARIQPAVLQMWYASAVWCSSVAARNGNDLAGTFVAVRQFDFPITGIPLHVIFFKSPCVADAGALYHFIGIKIRASSTPPSAKRNARLLQFVAITFFQRAFIYQHTLCPCCCASKAAPTPLSPPPHITIRRFMRCTAFGFSLALPFLLQLVFQSFILTVASTLQSRAPRIPELQSRSG